MPKELARGAEAVLYEDRFEENNVLVKERIKKGYRIEQIDNKLRTERTRSEARLINDAARAGVSVPKIFSVDEKENKIIMEFIEGKLVKDVLNEGKEITSLAKNLGMAIGKLHSAGIVHGDLTTSNMILSKNKIVFIDFGLGQHSSHQEDQATDLAVLHEAIRASNFENLNTIWPKIVEAYKSNFTQADKVLKALQSIESRGRYVRRGE